jgi:hypothetical protein
VAPIQGRQDRPPTRRRQLAAALLAVGALLGTGLTATADGFGGAVERAAVRQTPHFVAKIDNPWYPLTPGTTYVYRGVTNGRPSRDVVTVTHRIKIIDGAACVPVKDNVYIQGQLRERTTDWYSQDERGAVWYFGEATAELDSEGRVTSTWGSWQAGRDGAKPGIVMPAHPRVGQSFRQEFLQGQAEDHLQILSLGAPVKVPYRSSRQAILTKEWSPLEPGVLEHKLYVSGIGLVRAETIAGGSEQVELVAVKKPR